MESFKPDHLKIVPKKKKSTTKAKNESLNDRGGLLLSSYPLVQKQNEMGF